MPIELLNRKMNNWLVIKKLTDLHINLIHLQLPNQILINQLPNQIMITQLEYPLAITNSFT